MASGEVGGGESLYAFQSRPLDTEEPALSSTMKYGKKVQRTNPKQKTAER